MKKIYLCGGINGLSDSDCRDWREATKSRLFGKYELIDPMRRDYRGLESTHGAEVVSKDLADINNSDIVLVNAVRPSWGTAMEMFYAFRSGKTVIAVHPNDNASPWLVEHAYLIFKDFESAFSRLEKMASK